MSWFHRNPLDDILPGEPMPGVPERGSVEETKLIDKVAAERPWRGLWYGFFYFLRLWRFTAYTLLCGVKFALPFWSFIPLVAFGVWTDLRDRRTAPDLNISDRTYVTHILRQETLRPDGAPNWRDYFGRSFIWWNSVVLLIMPFALYGALQIVNACGPGGGVPAATCVLSQSFLILGPTLCVLGAFGIWLPISRYTTNATIAQRLKGALTRTYWRVSRLTIYSPFLGSFGLVAKVTLSVMWLFLFLLFVLLPLNILPTEDGTQLRSMSLSRLIDYYLGWILCVHFLFLLFFFRLSTVCWQAKGGAIASCVRAYIANVSPKEQST